MGSVLITGASGLIGKRLTELLVKDNIEVRHLSRSKKEDSSIPVYQWNIKEMTIEEGALNDVETVIHLAGASIASGRWTSSRKKELISSRIDSANLLAKYILKEDSSVKNFISANAIGIYGSREDEWLYESSALEDDWLARLCKDWEQATDQFTEWGIRTASMRIGLVMATEGGALAKLLGPAKLGVNPILGNGKQWYSWIHIDDIVNAMYHLIKNESLNGPFNLVAPNPVTQKAMAEAIDTALNKKTIKPFSPAFMMKLAMGQMAQIVLQSARVSSEKLESSGFSFRYKNIDEALKDLVSSSDKTA